MSLIKNVRKGRLWGTVYTLYPDRSKTDQDNRKKTPRWSVWAKRVSPCQAKRGQTSEDDVAWLTVDVSLVSYFLFSDMVDSSSKIRMALVIMVSIAQVYFLRGLFGAVPTSCVPWVGLSTCFLFCWIKGTVLKTYGDAYILKVQGLPARVPLKTTSTTGALTAGDTEP